VNPSDLVRIRRSFLKALNCEHSRPDVSRVNLQGGTVIVDRT
jgi:hypothetical protein